MKKENQAKKPAKEKRSNRKILLISIISGIVLTAVSCFAGGIITPETGNVAANIIAQVLRNFLVYSAFIFAILYFLRSRHDKKHGQA